MNIYEKDLEKLRKVFPNFDSSVTVEEVKEAIYKIDSFLDRREYTTDRHLYTKLKGRLQSLLNRRERIHGKG